MQCFAVPSSIEPNPDESCPAIEVLRAVDARPLQRACDQALLRSLREDVLESRSLALLRRESRRRVALLPERSWPVDHCSPPAGDLPLYERNEQRDLGGRSLELHVGVIRQECVRVEDDGRIQHERTANDACDDPIELPLTVRRQEEASLKSSEEDMIKNIGLMKACVVNPEEG